MVEKRNLNSRKTIYLLNDLMFIFWYRFVKPELSRITAGLGETVCDEVFSEQINSHIGYAFEECAKQYMWHSVPEKRGLISFRTIGRWWGNNPKEKREEEIDFIAYSGKKAVFGECKWRSMKIGENVLEDLMRKSELLPAFSEKQYALFSKAGFTDTLLKRSSNDNNVFLVDLDEMFRLG